MKNKIKKVLPLIVLLTILSMLLGINTANAQAFEKTTYLQNNLQQNIFIVSYIETHKINPNQSKCLIENTEQNDEGKIRKTEFTIVLFVLSLTLVIVLSMLYEPKNPIIFAIFWGGEIIAVICIYLFLLLSIL